jgi:hypothetical protein
MSKVAISGNASGTGVFTIASPNSNTDRTLTLPDNSGTVLTTATPGVPVNGPAFRAFKNAAQTISSGTFTKVTLPVESFDTASAFDSVTNHRFQPTVPGYYQINAKLIVVATSSLTRVISSIRFNGVESGSFGRGVDVNPGQSFVLLSHSELFYLNGSTDYVELWAWASGTGTITVESVDANTTVFSGFLARAA